MENWNSWAKQNDEEKLKKISEIGGITKEKEKEILTDKNEIKDKERNLLNYLKQIEAYIKLDMASKEQEKDYFKQSALYEDFYGKTYETQIKNEADAKKFLDSEVFNEKVFNE